MEPDRTVHLHGGVTPTVTIRGDRIAAVGEDAPSGAERVDLDGAAVLPGFVDAHVHFPSWALLRRELSLYGVLTLPDALDAVRGAAAGSGWLRGRGWRDEAWPEGERPTRQALDAVVADRPVALVSHDGHSLWLNAAALAATDGDLRVPGGVVEIDSNGDPTGILREESAWQFFNRHAAPSAAETLDAVRAALPAAHANGVTGIHDKDGGRGAPEAFAALEAAGELTLRVWQSLPLEWLSANTPGLADNQGALHRVGYLKGFMDGTLGSRTARLLDGTGVEILSRATLAPLEPIAGLAAAVTRTADERPPWRPEQAIGIAAALASYTTAPPEDIASIRVLRTMVAGAWVHGPP